MITGTLTIKGSAEPPLKVAQTTTILERMKGLLGKYSLPADEALLITPCNSVHMFFMRFPIDVVFLSEDLQILKISNSLQIWRMAGCSKAKMSLELCAGTAKKMGLKEGMFFDWTAT